MRMGRGSDKNLDRATGRSRSRLRDLTDTDRGQWADALDERERMERSSLNIRSQADVITLLRNVNPVRWRRLCKDMRWAEKEMKKMGLNPEDAKFLV